MNNGLESLQESLPLPVNELVKKFPFSGPLRTLSATDSSDLSMARALFTPLPQMPKPANFSPDASTHNTDPLIFEPYHTVDYFASQGIKPPALESSNDRFGQQLKSFTDWLKVMKRVPLTEVTRQIPVEKEKEVAAMAVESLDDKQVWTEAMAEVWVKQGEKQKAVQVYRKLSLLDPSKSAYFAAKISELN